MQDLKQTVAKNIAQLRKQRGITQLELAEKLNYSDKAVSKWERGESIPDIATLKEIAHILSVRIDYLVTEEHNDPALELSHQNRRAKRNHKLILGMCIMLVWLIATFIFVLLQSLLKGTPYLWMAFLYAIPATFVVWLVFNCIWFYSKYTFPIISGLIWSTLLCIYLSLLLFAAYPDAWLLFFIGIPAQIIVILWSGIRGVKR